MLALALARLAGAARHVPAGTPLRVLQRGDAKVYLFGFGEAKDESWATPELRSAFESSSEVWLEVSHEPGLEPDAASKREQLTHDANGRSFFDVLVPEVRARAKDYCAQLGIAPEQIAPLRPWSAFYAINGAYWRQHKPPVELQTPDGTLTKWAKDQGKPIQYEMPSQLAFARFMAAMPDAAQSQYMTFLFDFLDDQTAGRNQDDFGWIHGDTAVAERAVDRMHKRTPALYRIMQVQRNAWWAQTIDRMLTGGGTHFVGVGQMHAVGPDGIPRQLIRYGGEEASACEIGKPTER
jgi:uncharacterized protein YbaP (TraB family)